MKGKKSPEQALRSDPMRFPSRETRKWKPITCYVGGWKLKGKSNAYVS